MIAIQGLTVRLPGFVLADIDLSVEAGDFFALIGPTGAGKTLILESIAGLVRANGGRIRIGGRDVTDLPPESRGVGIVYQDNALFPHLSVRDNIRYGLRYRPQADGVGQVLLEGWINRLGLAHLLDRRIHHLSGGEKQRVALARALAIRPSVLLLDEPLSALDPNFREEIRLLLYDLHQESKITILMVTHDFSEAHFLARHAAVIHEGRIQQADTLKTVFTAPATPFVAEFVGMKNILPATVNGSRATVGDLSFEITPTNGAKNSLAIRPEDIQLFVHEPVSKGCNLFEGAVTRIKSQGVICEIAVDVADTQFMLIATTSRIEEMNVTPGQPVYIRLPREKIHLL